MNNVIILNFNLLNLTKGREIRQKRQHLVYIVMSLDYNVFPMCLCSCWNCLQTTTVDICQYTNGLLNYLYAVVGVILNTLNITSCIRLLD